MWIGRLTKEHDYMRQTKVTVLVMCLQLSLIMTATAVNAGCDCVLFDDTYGKEYGVFTSPNWPVPYEDNISCLLYTFSADQSEIVEITFDEFDVQKSTHVECTQGDFVKLFLHLKDPSVNEYTPWNAVLCGRVADIEQTHYSSGYSLIFEFHTDTQRTNNTGFRGTYRFLNKELYRIDGELLHGSYCDYQFISGHSSQSHGMFYSPQYPSTYPLNAKCAYHFMGKYNEKVRIVFEQVRLEGDDVSCLNSHDVIYVHDGKDIYSPVVGHLCSTNPFAEILSSGPDVYIEFQSKSSVAGQGFKASYVFEEIPDKGKNSGIKIFSTEPDKKSDNPHPITMEPVTELTDAVCEDVFTSDKSKTGVITSPNFPGPYPPNVHCTFHLVGRGRERAQLVFSDFELYKPDDASRECKAMDSVIVFVTINGQKEKLDVFCGNNTPVPVMANGPTMTVEFVSHPSSVGAAGFRAIYQFLTNFGIYSGQQDFRTVCGFIFNSSKSTNGTFTSPNWPGLYPRNTECHFFFYGKGQERVYITFTQFDVEGVIPCTSETASDYVEFSNLRTTDGKIPRHCGLKKPQVIESEGNFFRVTFKSNDRFDGMGFEALYEFRNYIDNLTVKKVRNKANFPEPFAETVLLTVVCVILSIWLLRRIPQVL